MDWAIIGATLLCVVGLASAYAGAAMKRAQRPPRPCFEKIKQAQARQATKQRSHFDGISPPRDDTPEQRWIREAVRRLLELWPGMGRERARREIVGYMECFPMSYGDPGFDWSMSAARELAEAYVEDFGEDYGSNA